jgi:hypothetical protein
MGAPPCCRLQLYATHAEISPTLSIARNLMSVDLGDFDLPIAKIGGLSQNNVLALVVLASATALPRNYGRVSMPLNF